ncbi:hypothetical protein GGP70_001389 [Salinibacter ruber]|jgi:hypothetical protein|nr:hypothetical protein [Salinibacter ruber]MCS3701937.1 hypothetical protein [Salinibacter ruber]MCS3755050.1 hypothetical protein [Salinibacter ruber]
MEPRAENDLEKPVLIWPTRSYADTNYLQLCCPSFSL